MTAPQKTILRTLVYSDLFDFAPTLDEIYTRLTAARPLSRPQFNQAIEALVASGQLFTDGRFYFLPGRHHLSTLRRSRLRSSTAKHLLATNLAQKLSRFSFIEAIFLTGTVAAANAQTEDDIDLLFVIRPGMLWFGRLIITLTLDFFGLRRKPGQTQVRNLICANLYLDTDHLAVAPKKRNLYTAHEVILAQPIFDRGQLGRRFLVANSWIKQYLPHAPIPPKIPPAASTPGIPVWLETICYNLQKRYMSAKITRETIGRGMAYFHPLDTATLILNRYHRALTQYELK